MNIRRSSRSLVIALPLVAAATLAAVEWHRTGQQAIR